MRYAEATFTQTLEVKQSKFIAYFLPYSLYDEVLIKLKQEHPKARHFVTAYRYLNEYNHIVENSSDDGEPKGTSGKPSLMVLQGGEIINSAVIIVRYFGGTKLGTGGLVRAYSDAVNLVLESASLIEYQEEITRQIEFEYSYVRLIDYKCEQNDIKIIEKQFDSSVTYMLKATEENMGNFLEKMKMTIQTL